MMEGWIFAGLVGIAIVSVALMQPAGNRDAAQELPSSSLKVQSFLDAYMTMPSQDADFEYTHKLEEMMFRDQALNDAELRHKANANFLGLGQRIWLQHEGQPVPVYGPEYPPLVASHTEEREYIAKYGTTIIQPSMSPYGPNMAIDLQLLPLWANNIPESSGIPYTITVSLTNDTGDRITRATTGYLRVSSNQGTDAAPVARETPIRLYFADDAHRIIQQTTGDLNPRATYWDWDVRLRLAGSTEDAIWLQRGDVVRFYPPAGWDFHDFYGAQDWTLLEDPPTEPDPILRFEYTGTTQRGLGTYDLRLNLTRPQTEALSHFQVLHAMMEGARTSTANLMLAPLAPTADAPLGLHVSGTDPLDRTERPLEIQITNPRLDEWTVDRVEISLEDAPYQFRSLASGIPSPANYGTNWVHSETDGITRLTWTADAGSSGHTVDGNRAKEWVLDLNVAKLDGGPQSRYLRPVLNTLDDGAITDQYVGHPAGTRGHYEVLLPPNMTLGDHALQVPRGIVDHIPIGNGQYTIATDALGLLSDVQRARHTMSLDVYPPIHKPGDSLTVTLDTGELFRTVRNLDAIDDDAINLHLEATDLFGRMTGETLATLDLPLDAALAAGIVGFGWTDVGGRDGTLDLIIAYSDGHLVALDGAELDEALWRIDLEADITAGPLILDVGGALGDEIIVAAYAGQKATLRILERDSTTRETVNLQASASHLIPSTCTDDPGVVFFETKLRNGAPTYDVGSYLESDIDWTQVARWSAGTIARSEREFDIAPFALHEGHFAPFAQCHIVYGVADLDEGRVVRINGDMEEAWRYNLDSRLRGLWVEDTHTTPVERPSLGVPAPTRSDELIVVSNGRGMEVIAGWVPYTPPTPITPQGFLPGDRFLGLSWVDRATGYAATELGYVWKTTDAGRTWGAVNGGQPVTDVGRLLVDFTFGGNGIGLFLDADYRSRIMYADGQLGDWSGPDQVTSSTFFGLSETNDGPGEVRSSPVIEMSYLGRWNTQFNSPSTPGDWLLVIDCRCSETVAKEGSLVGYTTENGYPQLIVATSGQRNVLLDSSPLGLSSTASGGILVAHADRLIWNDNAGNHTTRMTTPFDGSLRSGRHAASADLLYEASLFTRTADQLIHTTVGTEPLQGVSGGPGARWLARADALVPVAAPTEYWYRIHDDGLLDEGREYWVAPLADDESLMGWQVHGPSGQTTETRWGVSRPFTWEPGTLLRISETSDGAVHAGKPIRIEFTDGATITLHAQADPDCNACLAPIGDDGAVRHTDRLAADAAGLLPRVDIASIGPDPALGRRGDGSYFLAAGAVQDGFALYNVSTGLVSKVIDAALTATDDLIELGVVDMIGTGDVLWIEQGLSTGVPPAGGGILPPVATGKAIDSEILDIDVDTGAVLCDRLLQDSDSIGKRVAVQERDSGTRILMGTGLGRVLAFERGTCHVPWERAATETGSRLRLLIPPSDRQFLGPILVNATISLELDAVGTVDLYLMDYSIRSTQAKPESAVYYMAALSVWLDADVMRPPEH